MNSQLSELCDFDGVEAAAEALRNYVGGPVSFNEDLQPPFEIAGMNLPQAVEEFGAEQVLKYIYDFAEYEAEKLDESCDYDTTKLDENDDRTYCELNLFMEQMKSEGLE